MSAELEKTILGALIFNPSLIETCPLIDGDFSEGIQRKTFQVISEIWEFERPGKELDPVILAEKIKEEGAFTFISSLMSGAIKLEPEIFLLRTKELKKKRLGKKIVEIVNEQAKSGFFDFDEIEPLITELKDLESSSGTMLQPLSLIEPVKVKWLWENFIPLGRGTIIAGDPGVGKTWVCLDLAARLSRGLTWPDGSPGSEPANSIYLIIEDMPDDTLRPRIDSLGGDPARIRILTKELLGQGFDLSQKKSISRLKGEIRRTENIRALFIDPILDFSGKINSNRAEAVRSFLNPLVQLASEFELGLIMSAHLNKQETQSAVYRTAGSASGWLGKARAAFLIFRDQEDKKKRYLKAIKNNLAREDPQTLSFYIRDGKLVFEKCGEVDAEEYLNPQRQAEAKELSRACRWLKDFLAGGQKESKEIRQAANEFGIPKSTLYDAAHKLGVVNKTEGFGAFKLSFWSLP